MTVALTPREHYNRQWSSHKSRGPVNPTGPHHAKPNHVFAELCDTAEARGLRVHLAASAKPLGRENQEYRLLTQLTVGFPEREPLVTVPVLHSGLPVAAAKALDRLLEAA